MSFLAPLFLVGALAVALPVVFHLIRRTTRERTPFSSLMFLSPSPPRLTRRSRLEHILLLILRCAVICLLALGFARPFLKKALPAEPASAGARRIILLVDASASMRRDNLWTDARARVESIVRKASPADQLALYTFDLRLTPLVTFDQWNAAPASERAALVSSKLAEASPGWLGTHLGNALISAAETLADTAGKSFPGPRQILLISDLQEGSRLDQLQAYEWPKGIDISVEPLKARQSGNAGLQLVTTPDDAEPQAAGAVRVHVSNSPGSKRDQFQVGWAQADSRGFAGKPLEVYVPAGQSRTVAVPTPSTGSAVDRIILQGDDEDFDNTVFVIPPEQARSTVLYCGTDSETNPKESLYFLQRAFQETRRRAVKVLVRRPDQPLSPAEAELTSLFLVTAPVGNDRADALRQQVLTGKTLLFALSAPESAVSLGRLLGVDRLAMEEARPAGYAMLAEIDFRHPLFAPFADPRFSDFTKIHFWKYRRLDASAIPNARVLAKFDRGDPAILEVPVGKGRLFVFASGWRTEDSQLALSTKFVPLLYSLLDESGASAPSPGQYYVGDVVPLASLAGPEHGALTIRTPSGSELSLTAGETNFSQTLVPGIYTVSSAGAPRRFAVNLDAAESRTAPIRMDELERLGAPISRQVPVAPREVQRQVRLQNAELESRQKLWRVLLIAAMAMLLLESWLAGRTMRPGLVRTVP